MKCPNCNAEIADTSKFCSKCGTKIEAATVTQKSKPEETVECIKCGAELKKGAKFCAKCGTSQIEMPETKAEPEAKTEPETKTEPKPIPPTPVQPWKTEPKAEPVPPKKKSPAPLIAVVAVVVIVIIACGVMTLGKRANNDKAGNDVQPSQVSGTEAASKPADPEPASTESASAAEGTGQTAAGGSEAQNPEIAGGVKGDPALLNAADEKVTASANAYADNSYVDAVNQGKSAIEQYMEIAKANNLKEEAQPKIQTAFEMVSKAAVTYCTNIEEQHLGSAGFNEVRNTAQPIEKLLDSLAEEGYVIDAAEFHTYYDGVIPRFRDYYILKINEITEREQWSRDEAWTYAKQAYSVQDNGQTLLFEEDDQEDPLQMRFVYCRGWIYRKRCETGLADGSMTYEDSFNYMIEVLQETDYNLLVLDDLIAYGKAAGKDVTKYQAAYDAIIEEIKTEQGLSIVNNGGKNQGASIDIKKFWYFNDLDGEDAYKVDDRNGTTKATRKWIRENIPEYFK